MPLAVTVPTVTVTRTATVTRTVIGRAREIPLRRSMETQIAQLVSEAFVYRQAGRHIQQEQMRDNAAVAVREAILVHARPMLNPDASLDDSKPLSAGNWKRLSSILVVLMPVFWFSVIQGLWGSVKVNVPQYLYCVYSSDGKSVDAHGDLHFPCTWRSMPRLISHPGEADPILATLSPSPSPSASKEWVDGLLKRWLACAMMTLVSWTTNAWLFGGAQS